MQKELQRVILQVIMSQLLCEVCTKKQISWVSSTMKISALSLVEGSILSQQAAAGVRFHEY